MIVGTAGHIDHGKTALIGALCGVDTDRLPEEKRRGISIELGYAFMAAPDGTAIGFVDVPGHEKLVHTMLAGATGIDAVMLVVAADDGVMPQTREHVAIAALLGLRRGVVALNKCDRADTGRIADVRAQVDALLRGTSLEGAPVHPTSAVTGEGVPALRDWLHRQAGAPPDAPAAHAAFRMPIDRVFTLRGLGTVVTGTVATGSVQPGDALALGVAGHPVRVRSVHAQGREAARAVAGQRCALNVVGLDAGEIGRGDWAVDPAVRLATDRLDVALTVWAGEPRTLRSGTPVHLHVGAADVVARLVVLDGAGLAPGGHGRVQLVSQRPIGAWRGDRVVLRDASATRTIAGGVVLDPLAPARHRATPQRLRELAACAQAQPADRLAALAAACPDGVDLDAYRRSSGLLAPWAHPADGQVTLGPPAAPWVLTTGHRDALEQAVLAALAGCHEREPDAMGIDAQRLRRLARPRLAAAVLEAAIGRMTDDGRIARQGAFLRLPAHAAALSATEARWAALLLPRIEAGGFDPPWVRDHAGALGAPEATVRMTLGALGRRGDVHRVLKDLYYHARSIERLASIARGLAAAHGEVRAAAFRDAAGIGRNRAVQILEYFDRVGLLRRAGPGHRIRADAPPLGLADGSG
jgi:selenocysteine-specific elongation factor